MSRNEWEHGAIVVPSTAWPALKEKIRTAHNALQNQALALASAIYADLRAPGQKGTQASRYEAAYTRHASRVIGAYRGQIEAMSLVPEDYYDTIRRSLFPDRAGKSRSSAVTPKRQDFPLANGATKRLELYLAQIGFDEKTRTLGWSVESNNHAVEVAHQHPVARAMMAALDAVAWTRGSGGVFTGNDEYNRDSRDPDGGGNYVTHSWGPLGERDDPAKALRKLRFRVPRKATPAASTAPPPLARWR